MNRVYCLVLMLFVIAGCDTTNTPDVPGTLYTGVYIVNEGTWPQGNAELSFFDFESGRVYASVFSEANPGMTLGDVAQHAVYRDGLLFVAVNNSGYVQVIDAGTRIARQRISTTGLPRNVCVVSPSKAYVTQMDSTVSVLDLILGVEVSRITTGPNPEVIVQSAGRVFVMNGGWGSGRTISVVDTAVDQVVSTISTPPGPTYAEIGRDGTVYAVCVGDYNGVGSEADGFVLAIDPMAMSIVDSLPIPGHPGKIVNGANDELYVLGPGVYPDTPVWRLTTQGGLGVITTSLVSDAFYGIGFDEGKQELYLSRAGDFVTSGSVSIYSKEGDLLQTLTDGIGIAPNGFVFLPRR